MNQVTEYTVSQISNKLKALVEGEFSYVKIRGEVSGYKLAPSGHAYLSLKDNNAVISAICWRGTLSKLKIKPEEGMELVCVGTITIYPGQSKYQLIIEQLEHAGIGTLMAMLEKRKAEFAKQGLFDATHKKPLPFLPTKIGIITSPTGAVIKDIIHRIEDRFPSHLIIWPVLVQGEKSAAQVSEAIDGFNKLEDKPDIIIIARGGGSVEDLWPFNEEIVVRSAFNSVIPIISAIGHETDYTLLDLVADLRAPTPTAAAEKAVPVLTNVLASLNNVFKRIEFSLSRYFEERKNKLRMLAKSLPNYQTILLNFIQRLDDQSIRFINSKDRYLELRLNKINTLRLRLKHPSDIIKMAEHSFLQSTRRLHKAAENYYHTKEQRLLLASSLLNSYSYKKTLDRGFAILTDTKNNALTSASQAKIGEKITAELHDGKINLTVS